MKLSRVSRKLPIGVVIASDTSSDAFSAFKEFSGSPFFRHSRVEANVPLTLTLEVPEKSEHETAALLRQMADELEGK